MVTSWHRYPRHLLPDNGKGFTLTRAFREFGEQLKQNQGAYKSGRSRVLDTQDMNNVKVSGSMTPVRRDGFISGYAVDSRNKRKQLELKFYLDRPADKNGQFIGSTYALKDRKGDGYSYVFQVPGAYWDNKKHEVYGYIQTNDGLIPLDHSPREFDLRPYSRKNIQNR